VRRRASGRLVLVQRASEALVSPEVAEAASPAPSASALGAFEPAVSESAVPAAPWWTAWAPVRLLGRGQPSSETRDAPVTALRRQGESLACAPESARRASPLGSRCSPLGASSGKHRRTPGTAGPGCRQPQLSRDCLVSPALACTLRYCAALTQHAWHSCGCEPCPI